MFTTRNLLLTAALTATVAVPASALAAAKSDPTPTLGGAPQMRIVDAQHATLHFAADRLPRTKSGKLDATITFAGGERVSGLKADGTHGSDITYVATVSSAKAMSDHEKFTVRFRLGHSKSVTRSVKLYAAGEHG
jgi:hypothetical protein